MKKKRTGEVLCLPEEEMLTGSGVGDSEKGIGYGGVDTEGAMEAASRIIMIDALFGYWQ